MIGRADSKTGRPFNIFVLDANGERKLLDRLEPSEVVRTLGVRFPPDHNFFQTDSTFTGGG